MPTYVIFDVEIRDGVPGQDVMKAMKPTLEDAGGRDLARGSSVRLVSVEGLEA